MKKKKSRQTVIFRTLTPFFFVFFSFFSVTSAAPMALSHTEEAVTHYCPTVFVLTLLKKGDEALVPEEQPR